MSNDSLMAGRLPNPKARRAIRRRAELSGNELAARIGVSPASLYAWEAGDREPTRLQRRAYVAALLELSRLDDEEETLWPIA